MKKAVNISTPALALVLAVFRAIGFPILADATPIKVTCVGDSITHNPTYTEVLGHLLGSNYIVSNYGMPGATMLLKGDGAYPTWGTGYADSTTNQPDIVVIMLGTNDSKPQNWAHKIDFISDYKRLIHHYQNLASHPKVYLNTCPFCYGENAYGILATNIQNEIVPEIKQIAREESLPWIDVNTATMGMPQNFPDNVHPNAAGATFMAKVVYDSLKKPWTDSSTLTPTQKPAPPGPTPHF